MSNEHTNESAVAQEVVEPIESDEESDDEPMETAVETMNKLIRQLRGVMESTSGCGARGQGYIDSAYDKLVQHCQKHPECREDLPRKPVCTDDGAFGCATGMGMVGRYL